MSTLGARELIRSGLRHGFGMAVALAFFLLLAAPGKAQVLYGSVVAGYLRF